MANVVEHKKFSLTNIGNNNNKFWNVTLYDNGDVTSVWGRQGDSGQSKSWPAAGRYFMEKKIREKEKKGYFENKTIDVVSSSVSSKIIQNNSLKDIAKKQIKASCPLVQDLIEDLIKINAHNILVATGGKIEYDDSTAQFKTTQGIVIPEQVDEARALLDTIANYVSKNDFQSSIFQRSLDEYLSLIPRDFGRRRVSGKDIVPTLSEIQKENGILDGLATSFIDAQVKPTKTKKTKVKEPVIFNVELNLVTDKNTIDKIKSYYEKTKKHMHTSCHYKLDKVYETKIDCVKNNFKKIGKNIGNIKELFHGTKCSNVLSIFKQGLIIPPAHSSHVTGRLYGNGIYASDISSKALNYATNFWGSGGSTDRIFMFLCDFAMGNIYYPNGKYGSSYPVRGYDSTFAKAGSGGVFNNEMIVYNCGQVNLKYLLEFK